MNRASAGAVFMSCLLLLPLASPLTASAARRNSRGPSTATNAAGKPQDILAQATEVEAARVIHAPVLNGSVQGSVRQLSGENVTLNGNASVSAALLVPGTPQVVLNGHPSFGGTIQGTGSAQPSNYKVTLNGNATLGNLVDRVDPVPMPSVPGPTPPAGTKDVTVDNQSQIPSDFSNIRDLTLNGNVGNVAVPPGAYRNFTANGNSSFTFGIQGSTQPASYSLASLTLNGGSSLQIAGPVVLNLGSSLTMNGSGGSSTNPLALTINIASGGVTLNGGVSLYATVQAPAGQVTINGNSLLQGAVACNNLTINGNGTLKGTPGALLSVSPTAGSQGQSLPVTLQGDNTHWLNGQTVASFGNGISVGGAVAGSPGPVNVQSPTTAIANLVISPTAALAPRTVTVTTPVAGFSGGESEALVNSFTVTPVTAPGAASSTVSTIAGLGATAGFANGAGSAARFNGLAGLAIGPDGTVYVADAGNNRIRQVQNQSGSWVVTTLAGNGTAGFGDGPAAQAEFNNPEGIAVDPSGNVYVADTGNNRIRKIGGGAVSTLAGNGTAGLANGAAASAEFNAPQGVAVDNQGNVYVADTGNSAARFISLTTGQVSSVAGDGTIGSNDSPNAHFNGLIGVGFDGQTAFIYLADAQNERIRRLDPSGTVITLAGADQGFADGSAAQARFAEPAGIAVDGAGKLIVADSTNSLIREVDPTQVASGGNQAVFTMAGTGARALADGAGNVASFFTPAGVAVAPSSAIIVADTGNQVLRQILLPPIIDSFSPTQGQVGATVTIDGERFDGRAPADNTVSFTKTGGGLVQAQVTAAARNQLTVTVPVGAATGPITVQTQGGTGASSTSFQVITNVPKISGFSPQSGEIGSTVVLTGQNFIGTTGGTTITFVGNGSSLPALITSLSATQASVIVPNGAMTGPITLATVNGQTTTASPFTVNPGQQDYQLTVTPSVGSVVQGSSTNFVVYLNSGLSTFSQLASLTVNGLPSGVTLTFTPQQITAGASSTLNVNLSGTSLQPGSYSFTVSSMAMVNGAPLIRTTSASLNVIAGGQTTLSGRVLSSNDKTPILGATVSLDGQTATTDAAGGFILSGINAGTNRPLVIDGRTASAANTTYPVITEPATIVAGQANQVPFDFFLPSIDTQFEVPIILDQTGAVAADTPVTNPRLPGVVMTIPKGAHLLNRDGTPVTRVSITPVDIDRAPAPLPDGIGIPELFTSQPGGATTDIPIPVAYTNPSEAEPGTKVPLFYFDHDKVQWTQYGFGDVSADGRTVVPEINPTTGKSYGLPDFSWHGPATGVNGDPGDAGGSGGTGPSGGGGDDTCPVNRGPDPVDYSSGMKIERETDVAFAGARGGISFERIFTSDLAALKVFGRFGRGFRDNYDAVLTGTFAVGGAGRIRFPEQNTGRLLSYVRTDPDGSLIFANTGIISMQGDTLRKLTDGSFHYQFKHGGDLAFDQNGRLTSVVDSNGNASALTYDSGGNLVKITDAVGRSITLSYTLDSAAGLNFVSQITDPIGRTWRYSYIDSNLINGGQLASMTDPLGNSESYGYNLFQLQTVTDKRGTVAKTISYDGAGRVSQEQFADGGAEQFNYALSGGIVTSASVIDPVGRVTGYRLNPQGYVVGMADPLGQTTTVQRDMTTNQALLVKGPCGCAQETKTYDAKGNVVTKTDALGNTETFQHDPAFNNVTQYIDKLGNVAVLSYDSRGNLTSITRAVGSLNLTTSYTYDSSGDDTGITDPSGNTTTFQYDPSGNVTSATNAISATTVYAYDPIGRAVSVADPLGRTQRLAYDGLRLSSVTDPAGAVTTLSYDPDGNEISITDALQNRWMYAYDSRNRLVSVTDPLGRTSTAAYDSDGELLRSTSPSGNLTQYGYDPRGLVESVTDPLGGTARCSYNANGYVSSVVDQRGSNVSFSYDADFRLLQRTDPVGASSMISYDAAGRTASVTDRLGRETTMHYDQANQLLSATYPDAAVTYLHDAESRITKIDDSEGGTMNWSYDAIGRVLSETTASGTVSYGYNSANEVTSVTGGALAPLTYGYDSAGRLSTITQAGETFTYSYDTLSRRARLRRPNGVTTAYAYDAAGQLASLVHSGPVAQIIDALTFSYNADGRVESASSDAAIHAEPSPVSAVVADAANRVGAFGVISESFDAEGQMVERKESTSGAQTSYKWDARGRLTGVTLPTGDSVDYNYDALGRRSKMTAKGLTTEFLYDGTDVVLDQIGGSVTESYITGAEVDERLEQSGAAGKLYFLDDQLGSTIALTDQTGAVRERESYDPFGGSSGSSMTRYGFAGRELDAETGLIFDRARWYDPTEGRFLSEDPLGYDASLNLYQYVRDDPTNLVDPSGMQHTYAPRSAPPQGKHWDRLASGRWVAVADWHPNVQFFQTPAWPVPGDMIKELINEMANSCDCLNAFIKAHLDLLGPLSRGVVIASAATLYDESIPTADLGIGPRGRYAARQMFDDPDCRGLTLIDNTGVNSPRIFLRNEDLSNKCRIKTTLAHELMHAAGMPGHASWFQKNILGWDDLDYLGDEYHDVLKACGCQ